MLIIALNQSLNEPLIQRTSCNVDTESRWSCFIDAAPSWMTLWQFFLKKLDQAFDANQNPSLYEP